MSPRLSPASFCMSLAAISDPLSQARIALAWGETHVGPGIRTGDRLGGHHATSVPMAWIPEAPGSGGDGKMATYYEKRTGLGPEEGPAPGPAIRPARIP